MSWLCSSRGDYSLKSSKLTFGREEPVSEAYHEWDSGERI